MVYAKADKRWGEADLTVISLELLTVFGAGPLALWICTGIARRDYRVAFWMIVLATGELYGGMSSLSSRAVFCCLWNLGYCGYCWPMLIACRLYDFRPRMADWESKP